LGLARAARQEFASAQAMLEELSKPWALSVPHERALEVAPRSPTHCIGTLALLDQSDIVTIRADNTWRE
jgi:hypothetical protein